MALEIMSEVPISMQELKDEIARIKKRDKELNFRASRTEEYLSQVMAFKKSKELVDILTKLNIPRLKESHIKKIADIAPKTMEELKVVLSGYTVNVSQDSMKKIVEAVGKL